MNYDLIMLGGLVAVFIYFNYRMKDKDKEKEPDSPEEPDQPESDIYNWSEINNLSGKQIVARTLFGEARGCSRNEKFMIGQVIYNRVQASGFPSNYKDVCLQAKQFSCWNEPQSEMDNSYKVRLKDLSNYPSFEDCQYVANKIFGNIFSQYMYIPPDITHFIKAGTVERDGDTVYNPYGQNTSWTIVEEKKHLFLRRYSY